MTGKLVPVRIVNRNGVHTTVYRKPAPQASATKIPAPIAAAAQVLPREELLDILSLKVRTICREQYNGAGDVDQPTIIRTINRYSTTTLKRLYSFLNVAESSRSGSTPSVIAHAVGRGESEEFISDSMNFLREAKKSSLVRSLRYYSQLTEMSVGDIDPNSDAYRSVMALMRVSDFIRQTHESNYSEDQESPYDTKRVTGVPSFHVLSDSSLVNYLLEHPEEEERIKAIIDEHKSTNFEVIISALENGSALGDGTL